VINVKFQTNGETQIYVFSLPFSKNVLSKDNIPGISLGMRETAVIREIPVPWSLGLYILMEIGHKPITNRYTT